MPPNDFFLSGTIPPWESGYRSSRYLDYEPYFNKLAANMLDWRKNQSDDETMGKLTWLANVINENEM